MCLRWWTLEAGGTPPALPYIPHDKPTPCQCRRMLPGAAERGLPENTGLSGGPPRGPAGNTYRVATEGRPRRTCRQRVSGIRRATPMVLWGTRCGLRHASDACPETCGGAGRRPERSRSCPGVEPQPRPDHPDVPASQGGEAIGAILARVLFVADPAPAGEPGRWHPEAEATGSRDRRAAALPAGSSSQAPLPSSG
jgi:hypothetical protein